MGTRYRFFRKFKIYDVTIKAQKDRYKKTEIDTETGTESVLILW
jgi:hypothetical protein